MSDDDKRADARADAGTTPWGESYDDLAAAALNDPSAPDVLALAAFLFKHGKQDRFRQLIADAVALNA